MTGAIVAGASNEPTRGAPPRKIPEVTPYLMDHPVQLREGDVWGYTNTEWAKCLINRKFSPPCIFRDHKSLCPSDGRPTSHGKLGVERKGFDPTRRPGCPHCLGILAMEQEDASE